MVATPFLVLSLLLEVVAVESLVALAVQVVVVLVVLLEVLVLLVKALTDNLKAVVQAEAEAAQVPLVAVVLAVTD
jgi:hypothetical protein